MTFMIATNTFLKDISKLDTDDLSILSLAITKELINRLENAEGEED